MSVAAPSPSRAPVPADSLQPAGPPRRVGLRVIANQLNFLLRPFHLVNGRFKRYGDAYRVEQEHNWLYVFRHPDHIRDVLVTNASAFDKQHSAFQQLSRVLGDALLTSDGERWRRQRRLVQPAFARARLSQYSQHMVEIAAKRCERLERGGLFDMSREMNSLTLAVVTRTLFGQQHVDDGRTSVAMVDLNRGFAIPPLWARIVPGLVARFQRAASTLDQVIAELIESKRASLAQGGASDDLLSALMLARDEEDGNDAALTPSELRDQLLTLYVAGHETTSHALTWTLYLLSRNPAVLTRLRAELARVLDGRAPSFADLAELTYTEQVVKEALRLYPPAFVIPRHASEDTQVGPYRVPKDSEVVLWIYATHHDPRWYPDPERFFPERFDPAQEAARPRTAYVPFGAGQRACIGQLFALIEAQLILATLVPRLDFEYARRSAPRIRMGVTLAARGGMPMQIERRRA
jgi:enediyne biosynthesis protein E7